MNAGVVASSALALSTAAGLTVVAATLGRATSAQEWIGRIALGAALGLGGTSLLAFAWLLSFGGMGPGYAVVDALVCSCAAIALLLAARTREALRLPTLNREEVIALAALLVAAGFATWRFVAATKAMPHGEWDAWEVWNFRARHIYRAGDGWREAFAPGPKSTEYPLLLPLSIVRVWAYGGESTLGPAAIAGLFTLGAPLLLAGLVSRVANPLAGTAAGLLLFATGNFQWWGAQQYGDVPVSAFILAGIGLLSVGAGNASGRSSANATILGGAVLGLAGWTKTDGLAAAAIASIAFVTSQARRGRAPALATARRIALGAAAPAVAWAVQHVVLTPAVHPDFTAGQEQLTAKLADAGRWHTVLAWLSDYAPGRDVWLLLPVIAIAGLLGARPRALLRSAALWCAAALYLVVAVVFVSTPLDLSFHLMTAGERLMLQPWPALLLALFAAARRLPAESPVSADAPPTDGSPPESAHPPPMEPAVRR